MADACPEHLCCPITGRPFVDPVVAPSGHTFERAAIEAWLAKRPINPLTREPLSQADLRPNYTVRDAVADWAERPRRSSATTEAPAGGELTTTKGASGDKLMVNQTLGVGEQIESNNGRAAMVLQGDGNLVLYVDGAPLWASDTNGQQVTHVQLRWDGLFIFNGATLVWHEAFKFAECLVVQDDSNLVAYAPDGHPVWSRERDTLPSSQTLGVGQQIKSNNGRAALVLQGDGNLVLYADGVPLWASNTHGQQVTHAQMQPDGLRIFNGESLVWHQPFKGAELLCMQDDCNLVAYAPGAHPVWATNTVQ